MRSSYSALMQSKFFSPAFNSAIFDGPFRIYFAQYHESVALKIYFQIQEKFKLDLAALKEKAKFNNTNILIMIYPSSDHYFNSFDQNEKYVSSEIWNADLVVGLKTPPEENQMEELFVNLEIAIKAWEKTLLNYPDLSL